MISSDCGAARSILCDGAYGRVLSGLDDHTLRVAIDEVLSAPEAARTKAAAGRRRFERDFDLAKNTETLACWLAPEP